MPRIGGQLSTPDLAAQTIRYLGIDEMRGMQLLHRKRATCRTVVDKR